MSDVVPKSSTLEVSNSSCGIVMPIAAMGDYSESHWVDVLNIIKESVALAGYEARLVSESADATVIIRSIVQNIYNDEIVVCDVSGMNPNVMFELGMRLAFDKPVVIIKDELTRFSFDISTIEHLVYPKSLRYQSIQQFKSKLADKIKATVQVSKKEEYRSFLTNFGSFTVANLKETTLNESEALETILKKLDKFDGRLLNLENSNDSESQVLSYLNKNSKKSLRPLMRIRLDSNFNSEKFEKISILLDSLYGEDVQVSLSGTTNNDPYLLIIGNIDLTERAAKRIRNLVDAVIKDEEYKGDSSGT
ncbi:TPA: hypothetical protein ITP45_004649 [Escherichia coli]|nr:hypothetical protein [Escherichia coli]